jgi:copper resistance protein B
VRWLVLLATVAATPALAQPADPHAGHKMPAAQPADPHAGHKMPDAKPADPHAGHAMPAAPAPAADPHAGHQMPAPSAAPIGSAPPPPAPTDHAADRVFGPGAMAAARETLRREHGVMRWTTVTVETAEVRPTGHGEGYGWDASVSYGGDIHRVVLKTEGEAAHGDLERAELQALYARAIGPYFNLQAGVRQDFEPRPRRTYAAVGVEGLAPYWFEVGAQAFLSDKGDVSARFEGSYDLRLTQKLILEPRGELNLAASDDRAAGVGSGLTDIELGVRLRYAFAPEFAPYVGVNWERKLGDTADLARAAGEARSDSRFVIGLRAWF